MDIMRQFYASVRVKQMLGFFIKAQASEFENISFIDKDALINDSIKLVSPLDKSLPISRLVNTICNPFQKQLPDNKFHINKEKCKNIFKVEKFSDYLYNRDNETSVYTKPTKRKLKSKKSYKKFKNNKSAQSKKVQDSLSHKNAKKQNLSYQSENQNLSNPFGQAGPSQENTDNSVTMENVTVASGLTGDNSVTLENATKEVNLAEVKVNEQKILENKQNILETFKEKVHKILNDIPLRATRSMGAVEIKEKRKNALRVLKQKYCKTYEQYNLLNEMTEIVKNSLENESEFRN